MSLNFTTSLFLFRPLTQTPTLTLQSFSEITDSQVSQPIAGFQSTRCGCWLKSPDPAFHISRKKIPFIRFLKMIASHFCQRRMTSTWIWRHDVTLCTMPHKISAFRRNELWNECVTDCGIKARKLAFLQFNPCLEEMVIFTCYDQRALLSGYDEHKL